ncbi:hypothetical protein [Saccharothrix obliqua]|uniref:hypothetical protein n=1 Tax=Saccharothrix obliqua TaxID=2861747 RepID=UPI001C5D368B|nr:hypothetical protein [Saccharothrix obliqua]MBW4720202.1 hypothetical protein [Saccharothrix obliqua]
MTKTWHRPTLWIAWLMAALTLVTIGGLLFDGRVLQGAPIWLKPFKFAVSLTVYSATLSWLLSLPHKGQRWTSALGTLASTILFADVALVAIQAARGTFSHFNTSPDLMNRIVQGTFALSIPVMFLANVVLAVWLSFQRLRDRPTTWGIRSGLYIAVLGMASGYLMFMSVGTKRTVSDAAGSTVDLRGGHSVGVPDGGDGMAVTAWSTTGGDLRIPHFFGMHGLQVMILVALGVSALALSERARTRLVLVTAVGYTGLFGLLTWQAIKGEPLLRPGTTTLIALACLVTLVAAGVAWTFTLEKAALPPTRRPAPQR